ncbi:MAG: mechanosensitive ion channel [Candidatus Aminicenantes bacterium]
MRDIDSLSYRQIISLEEKWEALALQTAAWQEILSGRSEELEKGKDELSSLREEWAVTRSAGKDQGYPAALQDRIESVLEEIEAVEEKLRKRLEAVISLQDEILTSASSISEIIIKLESQRERSRVKLLSPDSDPLWKAFEIPSDQPPLSQKILETWRIKVNFLSEFLKINLSRFIFHLALFLVLLLILIGIKKRSLGWVKRDESLMTSVHVLSRPVSVALLVSLLVKSWIYPQMPQVADDLIRLLWVFPLLRLLPGLVPSSLRRPIYILGSLYILQFSDQFVPEGTLLERLLLLGLTLLALGALLWFNRGNGFKAVLQPNAWTRALLYYSRFAILIFAFSTISNLLGNVSLAEFLAWGTFLSLYVWVILITCVLVLDDLIAVLLKSRAAQSLHMIKKYPKLWGEGSRRFLRILAVLLWIILTLDVFNLFDPVKDTVLAVLGSQLKVGAIQISLGDILAFALTLWLSILLARSLRVVLGEDVLPRLSLPRGVPAAISATAYYFILFLGFLFALSAAGIEWSRFALLAGALGVGIGFGLQNLVNNFVSGLILIFERPIKVGDFIEFGANKGEVLRIGIRSSTVKTWLGAEIIVPNGNLISSEVINWTLSDRRRRLFVPVGVAYGSDPKKVIALLEKTAGEHPEAMDTPPPQALFTNFGESSLDFEVRITIPEFGDWVRIQSEIHLAIHSALKEAGIEIPFPQHDLHLKSVAPEALHGISERANKKRSDQG